MQPVPAVPAAAAASVSGGDGVAQSARVRADREEEQGAVGGEPAHRLSIRDDSTLASHEVLLHTVLIMSKLSFSVYRSCWF